MISKNEAKYIQSLGHKKERQERGLFIAEGPKIVEELMKSDFLLRRCLLYPDGMFLIGKVK